MRHFIFELVSPATPRQAVVVRAGHIQSDEQHLRLFPHHVLNEFVVDWVTRIIRLRLGQHSLLASAKRIAGLRKKQAAHGRQLLQGITAGAFVGLVTIGPLVVARRVDQRIFELLEQIENSDIPVWVGSRRRGRQAGPRADIGAETDVISTRASSVDVADVKHQADVGIGVDRVNQQRRCV